MTTPRGSSTARVAGVAGCDHCGLPVPPGRPAAEGGSRFCCAGCRTAWALLHEHGLEGYYALADHGGVPVAPSGRQFEEFDHEAFRALYVRPEADGLATVDLYLEGVHCAACVWLVERVPLALPGVARAELDVSRALATVTWDPGTLPLSAIARFVDRLGYRPHPYRGVRQDAMRRREDRALLGRIGVAGALAANVMLLALAQYAGWFNGMESAYEQFFRWWSLALTLPAVVWPGRPFFTGAWAALRARAVHMDLPIAIALGAGTLRGTWNTIAGTGPIYFDGVTFLIFLLLVGRYLQQQAQRRAADAAELLHSLAPASARVLDDAGGVREVPVEALLPGVVVDVRAGETLPADGVVVAGRSALDLALLTGESHPATVEPGAAVWAGTVNLGAPLRVRVDRAGEESRLGRLLRQVEASARRRAPMVLLADRLAGWFVLVVLMLAAVTLGLWWPRDPTLAIDHAIAMLVITCPCALALATPLVVHAAIGQAARRGILIKNGEALEQLARPARVLLDKTGTLTEGRLRLVRFEGDPAVRPLAAALERGVAHPVARALVAAWGDLGADEAEAVVVTHGGGVEGVVRGRRVIVGTLAHVRARARVDARWEQGARAAADDGQSPVLLAIDGACIGVAAVGDALRPEATAAVARLAELGFRPAILSGDHPALVARAAAALGLRDAEGGATPETKLQRVLAAAECGPVVMVGDGVNDAGAIAAASVGIGVHGGAEACLATADVYLGAPGLTPLVELAEGARRTMRVIRALLAASLAYNLIGSAAAMAGLVDPLIAALVMPGTSVINIVAAWRIRTFTGDPR